MKSLLVLMFSLSAHAESVTLGSVQTVPIVGAHGMVFSHKNELILTDTFRSQDPCESSLFIFSKNEIAKGKFSGSGLAGISKTQTGYLISDLQGSIVYETDKNLKVLNQWAVTNPWQAKAGPDGQVYIITYAGNFVRVTPTGRLTTLISGLDAPFDFAFTENGHVWISEQGQADGRVSLWQFDKNKFVRSFDSAFKWRNPEGLIYQGGNLWVLDTELGELIKVSFDGTTKSQIKNLGIPILIETTQKSFVVFSNNYKGKPSLLSISL
ncbi:MAG: hypothetical protein AB7N80_10355 [Bdellovibrionales bacterium]